MTAERLEGCCAVGHTNAATCTEVRATRGAGAGATEAEVCGISKATASKTQVLLPALFEPGQVDPFQLHSKTGPTAHDAFDPIQKSLPPWLGKRTHKLPSNWTKLILLFVEKTANEPQQLDGAVGLGHVVVAPGSPCFIFIALHSE